MAHPELGREVLNRFAEALSDVSEVDQQPTLEGRIISLILTPKKK